MVDRVIVADDLTGALDAAAPFAARGIKTVVALTSAGLPEALASGARVVSVSTDSREVSPAEATAAVREVVAALPPGMPLFKKVDSRLKGNIAAELDAIPHRSSLVIPAIPAFGRIVRQGRIVGFGVTDPIDIAARLGAHAAVASIPDVATTNDIDRTLSADIDLPIGARGLAEALAAAMAPNGIAEIPLPTGPAFCVIGSTDPITLAQVDDLHRALAELTYIEAPNGVAPPHASASGLTLLQATAGSQTVSGKAVASALALSLERLALPAEALLVLSGGATAQVLLQALGIEVLEVLGETLPGLPISRSGRLTVVTKSGGFGEPDTLTRLLAPFHHARSLAKTHVG